MKDHPHAPAIRPEVMRFRQDDVALNLLFWMPQNDNDMESLVHYFTDLKNPDRVPFYNVTCVMNEGYKGSIKERNNLKIVHMLGDSPFSGEAGLIVLNDLKSRDFSLAIMKVREESIYEDSKLLDYLEIPRLVLTPTWETNTL